MQVYKKELKQNFYVSVVTNNCILKTWYHFCIYIVCCHGYTVAMEMMASLLGCLVLREIDSEERIREHKKNKTGNVTDESLIMFVKCLLYSWQSIWFQLLWTDWLSYKHVLLLHGRIIQLCRNILKIIKLFQNHIWKLSDCFQNHQWRFWNYFITCACSLCNETVTNYLCLHMHNIDWKVNFNEEINWEINLNRESSLKFINTPT